MIAEPLLTGGGKEGEYVQMEMDIIDKKRDKLTTVIENLKKTYWVCCGKNVKAVNRLYLGLEANEKFGLLGFNDSGVINLHGLNTKKTSMI